MAIHDGHIRPSSARRRQDRIHPDLARFCPPTPPELERWLDGVVDVGGDVIGLDDTGWTLPRLCPSRLRPGAVPRIQPACLVDVYRRPDGLTELRHVQQEVTAEAAVRASTAKIVYQDAVGQPGRNLRLRLETAYMADIEGRSSAELRNYLGLRDAMDIVSRPLDGEDRWRSRSADRIRRDGRQDWACLGAWPWAVFTEGVLRPNWRDDPKVARALAEWHDVQRVRLRRRLRRADGLHPAG